jgi:hypothetical protein
LVAQDGWIAVGWTLPSHPGPKETATADEVH